MSNERLRGAILQARLSIDQVAEHAGVDPKTITRWLGGRVPHPRHRFAVAALLPRRGVPVAISQSVGPELRRRHAELVAAFPFRADVDAAYWWTMITRARQQIDLLGYTLYFLPQQHPQLISVLLDKCAAGCKSAWSWLTPNSEFVRLREVEEQDPITLSARIETSLRAFRPLVDACSGAELRYQNAPLYSSVFRFDDEMLVTPHLYATPGHRAPAPAPAAAWYRTACSLGSPRTSKSIWATTTDAVSSEKPQPVHLGG